MDRLLDRKPGSSHSIVVTVATKKEKKEENRDRSPLVTVVKFIAGASFDRDTRVNVACKNFYMCVNPILSPIKDNYANDRLSS